MYKPHKRSTRYYATHCQDNYTDLGFKYKGRLFEKTISSEIRKNKNTSAILLKIEEIIYFLIETSKQIRLQYMISLDKKETNVN